MKFSELACCPFCGCKTFFQRYRYSGTGLYSMNFDGSEADNTEMYEGLPSKSSGRAYCYECGKYIGNADDDTVGAKAAATLGKGREHGENT